MFGAGRIPGSARAWDSATPGMRYKVHRTIREPLAHHW